MRCNEAEGVAVTAVNAAKLGVSNADGISSMVANTG